MIRRHYIKRRPRKNDKPGMRAAYKQAHPECACCHTDGREPMNHLELAHILGGRFGRRDANCNFLCLCRECHHERLIGKSQLSWYLTLKAELGELDREGLQAIIARCGTTYILPDAILVPPTLRGR